MPRYKLRTLLILLAIGPPLAAAAWFGTPKVLGLLKHFVGCCSSG